MTVRLASSDTVCVRFANEVVKAANLFLKQYPNNQVELPETLAFEAVNGRISIESFCAYLKTLELASSITNLGLELGRVVAPAGFNLLGHLVMVCPTIGEAMSLVTRYHPIVLDCADAEWIIAEEHCTFYWEPHDPNLPGMNILVDLVLAGMRFFGIWSTGIREPFSAVYFSYMNESRQHLEEEIFGCHASYNEKRNGIQFPRDWVRLPMHAASSDIQPLIETKVEQSLSDISAKQNVLKGIHQAIKTISLEDNISLKDIADSLSTSERTLQRQLKELGTTFKHELKVYRLDRARALLLETDLSISEIALSVGYSEHSSFTHAYKDWSGRSPIEERRMLKVVIA